MSDSNKKMIRALVSIGPNYAFHLMAAARIGFESEYADRYASSVKPDDLVFLQKHTESLTFGGGSTSELVAPIIAWPAYFNLDSEAALEEQYYLLDQALSDDNPGPFLKRYASHIKKMEKWWYTIDENLLKFMAPQNDLIRKLGRIVVRNFNAYRDDVWPQELPHLQEVASDIDGYFANKEIIEQWENITGRVFEFDIYHIVLCSAIKNGPNANSLGYDQVIFYSGSPRSAMMEFISHEVGTHILIGTLKEIAAAGRFEFPQLYEGYELLSRYYNTLILKNSPLSYPMSKFHVDEYLGIFGDLHREKPDISAEDLLTRGIDTFLARKPLA